MKKKTFKGGAMIAPVPPVMVSCGDMKNSNIITIAWTGIMCTDPPVTYISVRPSRHSYGLIEKNKKFVINLVPSSLVKECDFCGVKSGRDIDKFTVCKLTKIPSEKLSVPMIEECPVNIECSVRSKVSLGTHDVFISDIVSVSVNEDIIDKNGRIMFFKADLCAYAHGSYYKLGKHIGDFGFSVRKKPRKNTKKSSRR